jgi:AcrR family transcriptional regulator
MSKTKQKILRAAKLLFNANGVANVSQRDISEHIAISPGNLTYHFKKRDDIIEALYFELSTQIKELYQTFDGQLNSFDNFYELLKNTNKVFFEYRFFIIDLIHITRSSERIDNDFIKLSSLRKKSVLNFLNFCRAQGWMIEKSFPEEFENLAFRINIVSDFWLLSVGTIKEDFMLKHTRNYAQLSLQALHPYLSSLGRQNFPESYY